MKINSTKLPAAGGLAQNRLTLEPLRTDGLDALDSEGIEGISQITLVEIEVAWENEFQEVIVRKAADIFGCAAADGGLYDPIPKSGCLVQAVFLISIRRIGGAANGSASTAGHSRNWPVSERRFGGTLAPHSWIRLGPLTNRAPIGWRQPARAPTILNYEPFTLAFS